VTATPPSAQQYLGAYTALRQRLNDVLSMAEGCEPVPSCPDWTTRDVLAHLVGLCDDWINHRLDGYATGPWAANQVLRYSHHSLAELHQQWTRLAIDFARLDDDPTMGAPARWAFGDAIIHEADLRGALNAGRPPHEAVLLSLEGSIIRWRALLENTKPPTTLVVRTIDGPEWTLGPLSDAPRVAVSIAPYELFRALAGRRTAQQVGNWPWSHSPDAILSVGLPFPFHWANTPILD
jgi:uncharacterized protein (TIGR03083 family)